MNHVRSYVSSGPPPKRPNLNPSLAQFEQMSYKELMLLKRNYPSRYAMLQRQSEERAFAKIHSPNCSLYERRKLYGDDA